MRIASDACIYTNDNYTALHIDSNGTITDVDMRASDSSRGQAATSSDATM